MRNSILIYVYSTIFNYILQADQTQTNTSETQTQQTTNSTADESQPASNTNAGSYGTLTGLVSSNSGGSAGLTNSGDTANYGAALGLLMTQESDKYDPDLSKNQSDALGLLTATSAVGNTIQQTAGPLSWISVAQKEHLSQSAIASSISNKSLLQSQLTVGEDSPALNETLQSNQMHQNSSRAFSYLQSHSQLFGGTLLIIVSIGICLGSLASVSQKQRLRSDHRHVFLQNRKSQDIYGHTDNPYVHTLIEPQIGGSVERNNFGWPRK